MSIAQDSLTLLTRDFLALVVYDPHAKKGKIPTNITQDEIVVK